MNPNGSPVQCAVLTLIQELLTKQPEKIVRANEELATHKNAGWHVIDLTVTSTFNHATGAVETLRVVTLEKVVTPQPEPVVASVAASVADGARDNALPPDEDEEDEADTAEIEVLNLDPVPELVPVYRVPPVPVIAPGESPLRRKVVTGTIVGNVAVGKNMPVGESVPVGENITDGEAIPEGISYAEAVTSGRYSAQQLAEIGQREAVAAGVSVYWKRQQNRAGLQWESLIHQGLALPVR